MISKIEDTFEIGCWVIVNGNICQVIKIIEKYHESYRHNYKQYRVGDLYSTVVVIKKLCTLRGKIITQNRLLVEYDPKLKEINQKHLKTIKNIKDSKPDEYRKFVIYNAKSFLIHQESFYFKLPDNISYEEGLYDIKNTLNELPLQFSFNELIKLFEEKSKYFSLKGMISYHQYDLKLDIQLNIYSTYHTVINKKMIFDNVRVLPVYSNTSTEDKKEFNERLKI